MLGRIMIVRYRKNFARAALVAVVAAALVPLPPPARQA